MKSKLLAVLPVIVALIMVSSKVFAQYSAATYDKSSTVSMKGTITQFEFINPHLVIHFDVKDAEGNVEKWIALYGSPNEAGKLGWTKNTFQPGDQITISGH